MANRLPNLNLWTNFEQCDGEILEKLTENFNTIDFQTAYGVERGSTLPSNPSLYDQFIFDNGDNTIYTWGGSDWIESIPNTGLLAFDSTNSEPIIFDGNNWVNLTNFASSITASNLGAGSEIFKQKVGDNLEFRTLVAGANTSIIQNANEMVIEATGGSNSTNKTIVNSNNYVIAAGDTNIFLDGVDQWDIVMPNANSFDGRRIRFYVINWNGSLPANNYFRLVDSSNNVLYRISDLDLPQQEFMNSGNLGNTANYIELTSFGFNASTNAWSVSHISNSIISKPVGGLTDVLIDGAAFDQIFSFTIGNTELYSKAIVSTDIILTQPLGNNVYRFQFQTAFAPFTSWTSVGQTFEVSGTGMSGTLKSIIHLSEEINMIYNNTPEEIAGRLVGWKPAGVNDAIVEATSPSFKKLKIERVL